MIPIRSSTSSPIAYPLLFVTVAFSAGMSATGGERQALGLTNVEAVLPQRVTATGRIVPKQMASLSARVSGPIVAWGVSSDGHALDVGSQVKKGEEVFRIETDTYEAKVMAARTALDSAQAALADLKAGVRQERREMLKASLTEIRARMAEQKKDEERYRRLVEVDKTVPQKRLEEVQLQLTILEAQAQAAQALIDEAEAGPTPTQIAVAAAAVKQMEAQLKIAELDLQDTSIKAPFDGLITARLRNVGDYVNSAMVTEVVSLISLDELEAELALPETYFSEIVPGQTPVSIQSPLLPADLSAIVSRVVGVIDASTGSFVFRVALPAEEKGNLRPGAFIQGRVTFANEAQAVLVPQSAVFEDGSGPHVFVAIEGKMAKRSVVLGDQLTESVIVKSGLKPGEIVVLGPKAQLTDGAALPAYLWAEKKDQQEK